MFVHKAAVVGGGTMGGQIAQDLERLYNFMAEQLVKANMHNSKEALQSVQKLLETLHGAWKEAVAQAQKDGAIK